MSARAPQNNIRNVLLLLFSAAAFVLVMLPLLGAPRPNRNEMGDASSMRGIHQSMVIFGNANNDYLPGLSANGQIVTGAAVQASGDSQSGASFHARLWVLLNGQYIGGDLITSRQESLTKWTSGQNCTSANASYAGLQLGQSQNALNTSQNDGRAAEWKNTADARAIMLSDRLLVATESSDASVQSIWTSSKGSWKGNVIWGDGHFEFAPSQKGFATRYFATANTNDNLFVTRASLGVTESSTTSDCNAMMIYY